MQVQPYLFFDGRCEEAVDFYRRAVGAEASMLVRFCDSPQGHGRGMTPPGFGNKVMHVSLRIGATTLLAGDGPCLGHPDFQGFSLCLTAADPAEAGRLFAALADGGKVDQPLVRTFFAESFGMVTDRFGVSWMLILPAK
jgi:PhnB protein